VNKCVWQWHCSRQKARTACGKSASVKLIATHSPVNDSEPLDVCLQQPIEAWVGRGARWQCLVATDRANTLAKSRQFERGRLRQCNTRPDTCLFRSKVGMCVIHRSVNFCIMTKIQTEGACYRRGRVIDEVLRYIGCLWGRLQCWPHLLSHRWLTLEVRAPLNQVLMVCHRFKRTQVNHLCLLEILISEYALISPHESTSRRA